MDSKNSSQTHRSHHRATAHGSGRKVNTQLFIGLGALFIILSVYMLLSGEESSNGGVIALIRNFLIPAADGPVTEIPGGQTPLFILFFIPPVLVLVASLFSAQRYRTITLLGAFFSAIYLITLQFILFWNFSLHGGTYFNSFLSAGTVLGLTTGLLLFVGLRLKNLALLISTSLYFYLTTLLYTAFFGSPYDLLFPGVLVFSAIVLLIGYKTKFHGLSMINFILAVLYFALFWFRNFIVNAKTDLLVQFFVLNVLFYLLYYIAVSYLSNNKENSLPRWIQILLSASNLLYFMGSTAYILVHYFAPGYLSLFIASTLIVHLIGFSILQHYQSIAWPLPHHYTIILIASLLIPVVTDQNRLILFAGIFSCLMLAYHSKYKEVSAFWFSVVSLTVMVVYFFFAWIWFCIPVILNTDNTPALDLLRYGVILGGTVIGSLLFTTHHLQTTELEIPGKLFRIKKYDRLVRGLLHIATFLTMGWVIYWVVWLTTTSLTFTPSAWFIAGALFFIGAIRYYKGRQSTFKKPVLYLALALCLLYPLLVHWNMTIYRATILMMQQLNLSILLIHYLALALVVILGTMIIRRIYRQSTRKSIKRNSIELLTVVFIYFLLATEYDNLTVIFGALLNDSTIQSSIGVDQLTLNKFLPYSIIAWIIAVLVFIRSIYHQDTFLRNFAMVIYSVMLIKLFLFDFETLTNITRSIVSLLLGLFLIGFAFVYPKLLRGEPLIPEFKRSKSSAQKKS